MKAIEAINKETSDSVFSRECVYCDDYFECGPHSIIDHINDVHNFNLGDSENLVFISDLLDIMEDKLMNMQCLYCEETFTSPDDMSHHMIEENHLTVHPDDKFYDRFYSLNYLQPGIPWQVAKRKDRGQTLIELNILKANGFQDQWTGWGDDEKASSTCLFCSHKETRFSKLIEHMKHSHKFDIKSVMKPLGFYDRVKAVNFLREKILENCCPQCHVGFDCEEELQSHMKSLEHCELPDRSLWCDGEKYLKPVIENDSFLSQLEKIVMLPDDDNENEYEIFSEDIPTSEVSNEEHFEEILQCQTNEESKQVAHCLFCEQRYSGFGAAECMIQHMDTYHSFDWYLVMNGLSAEQQINLLCYIKQKSTELVCYICEKKEKNSFLLNEHRTSYYHTGKPEENSYTTPTLESTTITSEKNSLLRLIETDEESISDS